jgi:hypothetical protein
MVIRFEVASLTIEGAAGPRRAAHGKRRRRGDGLGNAAPGGGEGAEGEAESLGERVTFEPSRTRTRRPRSLCSAILHPCRCAPSPANATAPERCPRRHRVGLREPRCHSARYRIHGGSRVPASAVLEVWKADVVWLWPPHRRGVAWGAARTTMPVSQVEMAPGATTRVVNGERPLLHRQLHGRHGIRLGVQVEAKSPIKPWCWLLCAFTKTCGAKG